MKKYNIGQIIKYDVETNFEGILGGKQKLAKKGERAYIGAENSPKFSHFLDGNMLILDEDTEIQGFSVKGIAEWIYEWLSNVIELDDMIESYDVSKNDFKEYIEDALEELGMWDNTGNRS